MIRSSDGGGDSWCLRVNAGRSRCYAGKADESCASAEMFGRRHLF